MAKIVQQNRVVSYTVELTEDEVIALHELLGDHVTSRTLTTTGLNGLFDALYDQVGTNRTKFLFIRKSGTNPLDLYPR